MYSFSSCTILFSLSYKNRGLGFPKVEVGSMCIRNGRWAAKQAARYTLFRTVSTMGWATIAAAHLPIPEIIPTKKETRVCVWACPSLYLRVRGSVIRYLPHNSSESLSDGDFLAEVDVLNRMQELHAFLHRSLEGLATTDEPRTASALVHDGRVDRFCQVRCSCRCAP